MRPLRANRPTTRLLPRPQTGGVVVLSLLVSSAGWAQTDDTALLRCSQAGDSAARLSCYDALAEKARARQGSPAAKAAATEAFGKQVTPAGELKGVDSRITGRFEGWGPRTRLRLANGQVWEVIDGSSAVLWLENPVVRVVRGALGSFVFEVEGANTTARVRRVE